jgi:hypothetical protein
MLESRTSARTEAEVWEKGLPRDGDVVVWTDPYRFYKAVAMMNLDGEVTHYVVAEVIVKTNHPAVKGLPRKRCGLWGYVNVKGGELAGQKIEMEEAPGSPVVLKALITRMAEILPEKLHLERPERPEFPRGMVRCTVCESFDVEVVKAKVVVRDGQAYGVLLYKCSACREGFEVEKGEQEVFVCPVCGKGTHDNSYTMYASEEFVGKAYCGKCKEFVMIEGVASEEELAAIA